MLSFAIVHTIQCYCSAMLLALSSNVLQFTWFYMVFTFVFSFYSCFCFAYAIIMSMLLSFVMNLDVRSLLKQLGYCKSDFLWNEIVLSTCYHLRNGRRKRDSRWRWRKRFKMKMKMKDHMKNKKFSQPKHTVGWEWVGWEWVVWIK